MLSELKICLHWYAIIITSVWDPDPQDPHVFRPPGSGSISQKYGSGSGSFSFLINVLSGLKICLQWYAIILTSVWDPDPHVFRPPGSGSISQKYGSGSGSFSFLINVLSGLKTCLQWYAIILTSDPDPLVKSTDPAPGPSLFS